jgi:hypothetical protein
MVSANSEPTSASRTSAINRHFDRVKAMGQADARTKRRPARRLDPRNRRRTCRRTVILFSDFGPGNDSQGSGSA